MKETDKLSRDNKTLGRITLVTSIGDWLTYFAILKLATTVSGSIVIGTLSVAMKSAAVSVGALLIPMFVGVYTERSIILGTQWMSAALMAVTCASIAFNFNLPVPVIYSVMFLQTIFKQLFDAARESHSKALAQFDYDHRPMQAQILFGLFGAQFFGPLIAFALILKAPIWLPFLVDCLSFVGAGIMSLKLQRLPITQSRVQLLRFMRPFSYLRQYSDLRAILILRSLIWIPFGFYNILLFQIVIHRYELSLEHSTIPYAVLGLGAAAGSVFLRTSTNSLKRHLDSLSEGALACMAQVGFGLSALGFLSIPFFGAALFFVFLTGFAMGVNMVATMTLRRKLSTIEQLPEVMGLELLFGRAIEACAMMAMAAAVKQGWIPYQLGVYVAIALFIVSGLAHLRFKNARELKVWLSNK